MRQLETIGSSPLGAFPVAGYEERSDRLRESDTIVLYTDGITEARRAGEFYGEEGLASSAERHQGAPVDDFVRSLMADVTDFAEGVLKDDAALLAVRFVGIGDRRR